MRARFLMVAVGAGAFVVGCSLLTSLDGLRASATTDAGATDGSPLDAAPDAADAADAAAPPMLCDLDGVAHTLANNAFFGSHVDVHPGANKGSRIGVSAAIGEAPLFFDVPQNLSVATAVPTPTLPAGSTARACAYDGGWVVLDWDGSLSKLQAFVLRDGNSAATPVTLTTSPAIPGGASQLQGAVAVVDALLGTFLVLYSYKDPGPGDYVVHGGVVNLLGGALTPLLLVRRFKTRPELDANAILLDRTSKKATVLLTDVTLNADLVAFSLGFDGTDLGVRTVPGPNGAHFPGAFAQPLAAKNGVALLEGDLQNASVPTGMRVSLVDDLGATTFDPNTFPPLVPLSVPELAVDQASASWQSFASGTHVVLAGRATSTGKGVNLVWLDGTGNLRARRSGATVLLPSEQVRGAGAALAEEPSALLAKLTVAWITETTDLRMATLGCLRP